MKTLILTCGLAIAGAASYAVYSTTATYEPTCRAMLPKCFPNGDYPGPDLNLGEPQ